MSVIFKLGVMALPFVIAIATNPSPREYRAYVFRKNCLQQQAQTWDTTTTCHALKLMPTDTRHWTLDQYIFRQNYWVFSIYMINFPSLYDESLGFGLKFIEMENLNHSDHREN